jgi:broad specificity phosphatase PhoE
MTLLLLTRHGATDAVGKIICGQLPGYPLNEQGRAEAALLARSLSSLNIAAVYSSPLERARETAAAVAAPHGLSVVEAELLTDIDFGQWNARAIADLESEDSFRRFNQHRSFCGIPQGERVSGVQARVVDALADIAVRHAGATVVVVSHGDPIRLALAFYLGLAVDHIQRLEVGTGSVTALELNDADATLRTMNARNLDSLGSL